jgi:hypothetical protein
MDASLTLQLEDSLQCNAVSPSKHAASVAENLRTIKADEDADNSISSGLVLSSWPTLTSLLYFSCFRLISLEFNA